MNGPRSLVASSTGRRGHVSMDHALQRHKSSAGAVEGDGMWTAIAGLLFPSSVFSDTVSEPSYSWTTSGERRCDA